MPRRPCAESDPTHEFVNNVPHDYPRTRDAGGLLASPVASTACHDMWEMSYVHSNTAAQARTLLYD
jgi:hypothetical protein